MDRIATIALIKKMPEQFSAEELIEKILFTEKVEAGLKDSAEGKIHSTEEAKKKLKKWLK